MLKSTGVEFFAQADRLCQSYDKLQKYFNNAAKG